MYSRQYSTGGGGGGFGLTGPVPRDIWILLGVVFATFSLGFFDASAMLPQLLRLTSAVWQRGFLWQLFSYPFVGTGMPGIWFVIEVLVLFLFGRQVLYQLGSRRFWRLLVGVAAAAAAAAVIVDLMQSVLGFSAANAFELMQGQRTLLAILIAVFAVLNGQATILLFFVLPVQAKWFLGLEIVFGFLGFLGTHDLPGFVGICAAVAATVLLLRPGSGKRGLRDLWLRLETWWLRLKLTWLRRRRGFRIVQDQKPGPRDPWIH